ncbi:MAG: hypothetical protein PHQ32_02545 [Firmicutes bacterium]|nr:hypothetical protein [Bacillota bacterium]
MLELINKVTSELTIEEYNYILSELDCCVTETIFPKSIKGLTIKNDYGTGYIVYINSLLSEKMRKKAMKHELLHLYNEDFEKDKNLLIKEKENV